MIKKSVITVTAVLALLLAAIFIYRYQIMQYTAETLIRKRLPNYIRIDSIKFNFARADVILNGFRILNPPDFSKEYLVEVEKMACHYKLQGKTIFDGLELSGPVLTSAVLDIERLGNGKVNLVEAETLFKGAPAPKPAEKKPAEKKSSAAPLKLPEYFVIKNAKVIFMDRLTRNLPNVMTFENINADFTLKMDGQYTRILSVASTGSGSVNGDKTQEIKWVVSLDPTASRLTMSSRFEVSGVSIPPFETYYDKYSPLFFKSGKFSGLLIFDFDNGMIGSSDELRLSDLKFSVKQGYENAGFWETNVPDLVKYFTSPYGEIIFDFKIKGDMAKPQFYLGPKSKEAIIAMAVDKISDAIQKGRESSKGGASNNGLGKAQQYIDLFNGLMKKQ